MDFEYSAKVKDLQKKLAAFMDESIYPNEKIFVEQINKGERWKPTAVVEELKAKARDAGLWNLFLPEETGTPKKVTLRLKGLSGKHQGRVWTIDRDHGSPLPAYERMGRPRFPTREQFEALRKAAALPAAESSSITGGTISLTLQPHALALIEIR